MAGGDLHIRVNTSYGTVGIQRVFDASSQRNDALQLSHRVNVGGRNVWVTQGTRDLINEQFKHPVLGRSVRLSAQSDTKTERYGFLWLKSRQVSNLPKLQDGTGRYWPEEGLGTRRADD